jgi:hypothetical protein
MRWFAAASVAGAASVALALVAPGTSQAAPAASTPMTADAVVALIQRGVAVDLQGATVQGSINLTGIGTIAGPIRCHDCIFQGDVIARDVIFNREVDLSGSNVTGTLDMSGSRFERVALFERDRTVASHFSGPVNFSVAAFNDRVSFDGAGFGATADFTAARFGALASFTAADFLGDASFVDAASADRFDCRVCHFFVNVTFERSGFLKGASLTGV